MTRNNSFWTIAMAIILAVGMMACGKDTQVAGPSDDASPQALGKPAAKMAAGYQQQIAVTATVTQDGAPVSGAEIAIGKSAAGQATSFDWTGTTDADGKAVIAVAVENAPYASGYYAAQATQSGSVIGTWHSIPLNGGKDIALTLPVGAPASVTSQTASMVDAAGLKALHQLHRNAVGNQDLGRLMPYFTNDATYDLVPSATPLVGKAQIGGFFGSVFQAFPNFHTQPGFDNVLVSDNILVAEHNFFETQWCFHTWTSKNSKEISYNAS